MIDSALSIPLPPKAGALIEALRDIGYSLESALADIVDNSLTAFSTNISLQFGWAKGEPWIAIVDDGAGLDADELLEAMRPGSRDPRDPRAKDDIGRFGLGMKTASFSQCRRLTVISRKEGRTAGWVWDLDVVRDTDDWRVLKADEDLTHPAIGELADHGTFVLWDKIDRLDLDGDNERSRRLFNSRMESVSRHLALVFHRFVQGEPGHRAIAIAVNGTSVPAFDPFNARNPATVHMPEERVSLAGESVVMQPYILPHHTKVSPEEYERLAGDEGYLRSQGFYVYRSRRLIRWGTWFRLARQEELTKLARVRIDIPNALDFAWTVDVRKSRANPPQVVKERMKQIIERIRNAAKRPYQHRGMVVAARQLNTHAVWQRRVFNDRISYEVDLDHPLIEDLRMDLDKEDRERFDAVLKLIGSAFPSPLFYNDMASHPKETDKAAPERELLLKLARMMRDAVGSRSRTDLETVLKRTEPFVSWPSETQSVLDALAQEQET